MSELNEFDEGFTPEVGEETPVVEASGVDTLDDAPVPSEGTVLVAMRRGHKFVLPNAGGDDLVIEQEPVEVPREALKGLIKASNGRLYVVETKEG